MHQLMNRYLFRNTFINAKDHKVKSCINAYNFYPIELKHLKF